MKRLCYIMMNCRMINTSSVNINNMIFMTHFFAVNGTSIVERITFYYMILFWKGRINHFFYIRNQWVFFIVYFSYLYDRSNWLNLIFEIEISLKWGEDITLLQKSSLKFSFALGWYWDLSPMLLKIFQNQFSVTMNIGFLACKISADTH